MFGYFKEGYFCSKRLIADFELGDADNALQFHIHFKHLLFALEYKKEEVALILKDIKRNIVSGKYSEEFSKNKAIYLEKFRQCMTVIKATRRTSNEKIRNTRRKSEQTIPEYEITQNLMGSGITHSMVQDFGGFTLAFKPVRMEPVTPPPCN